MRVTRSYCWAASPSNFSTITQSRQALALVVFGTFKLVRPHSHPRWVGLRVGPRELVLWSFLMSSAHGAGLMLVPLLLGLPVAWDVTDFPQLRPNTLVLMEQSAALLIHTLAMLVVMSLIALVVYERLGVGVLRRAWLNLDLLWAIALVAAGVVTLFT
jgi:hypothetical protein